MHYLGGKFRLAKKFGHILDDSLRRGTGHLVEPFVGGFNVVPALRDVATATCADIHAGLISMYRALQNGTFAPPRDVSREEYYRLRQAGALDPLTTFVEFACSFSGKSWGGYASDGTGRNYAANGASALARKVPFTRGVEFQHCDYRELVIPTGATVYCDPPYAETTGYRTGAFDHAAFWTWATGLASRADVYVSEFQIPRDVPHAVAWSFQHRQDLRRSDGARPTNRLFRVLRR